MFSNVQYKILSLFAGGTFLLSLLGAGVTGALTNQGGQGPSGPAGDVGPAGPAGTDGREVEFSVNNNVLQWRYVGDTTWQNLDLDLGNGGGSIVNGGEVSTFTHWIFSEELISVPFPVLAADPVITNQAAYVASKVAEGYTQINNVDDLVDIVDNLAGRYVLAANIDLTTRQSADVEVSPFNIIPSPYDENYNNIPFTGILDGAGFTISNFLIDITSFYPGSFQNVGLFQEISGATIKNLTLSNFEYKVQQGTYRVAALSSYIRDSNRPTVIDQVVVDGFKYQNVNGEAYNLGGLIGQTDSDSLVKIYRSEVKNFEVIFEGYGSTSSLGGLIGNASGNVVIGDSKSAIDVVSRFNESDFAQVSEVGGAIGTTSGNALQIDGSEFAISGEFAYQVGGAVGNIGESRVSVTNTTTDLDIQAIYGYNGGTSYGGLFGSVSSESIVFINEVITAGSIQGRNQLGGFIGSYDMEGLLRIDNSTSTIDFVGGEEIGGVIGRTDDYPMGRVLFDGVRFAGSISNYIGDNDAISSGLNEVGGFIGYLDSSDTSNVARWNQVWIRNSVIDDLTITLTPELLGEQDGLGIMYLAETDFDDIGGAVGYSYEYNFIRLSNNQLETTINFEVENLAFDYEYNYNGNVGGLFGYVEYDQEIQLVNNQSSLTINYSFASNTSILTATESVYLELDNFGGAFGYLENGRVIDVAGDYTLNVSVNLDDNDWTFTNLDLGIYNIGGYAGEVDNDVILLTEALTTELNLDISLTLLDNASFDHLYIEIYNIGTLVGELNGFAIFGDLNDGFSSTLTLPIQEGVRLDVVDLSTIGISGNPHYFYILR